MINNVTLMGRLTARPELKTTQSGTTVTSFSIAVDRRIQPKEGAKLTDFINCVAWRNTAEFITRYFDKGDMIAVTGEVQTRQYKDKNGNNRIAFEVVINQASFCGSKNNSTNADNNGNSGNVETAAPSYTEYNNANWENITDEDELPF